MLAADLFLRPEGLPLLLVAPLVWFLLTRRDRARGARLSDVLGVRVVSAAEEPQVGRWRLRRFAFALGVLLVVLAALGPAVGTSAGELEWRGVDLAVCLDVSRSMLARDEAPDRLSRAKEQIRALAERARGDRLALVVFAGEARLVVPLTSDGASLAELADLADPTAVAKGGTDLGAALTAALDALQGGDGRPRAIVLLTDGEDLAGRGLEVARACRERGVSVHGLGFGSGLGSKITVGSGRFLRDARGQDVVSALDEAGLTRIAEVTGGSFEGVGETGDALVDLYEERILPTARAGPVAVAGDRKEDRFQWPLLLAFLLFVVELWLVDRIRR